MFTDGLCRQLQTIQAEKLFYQCPCQHDGLENIVQSKVGFNGRRTSFGLRARLTGSASNSGSYNYAKSSPLYKKNSPEAVENRFYFSDSTSLQRTRTVASSAKHGHCGQAFYHDEKVGVLLLNLGGPETLDDVQPFLYNLFADPDIIRLPRLFRFLQEPLARFISTLRAPKSQEGYAAIGGGSPLRKITDDQAAALGRALQMKDLHARVYVAMRYWHPFTEEALEQIKKDQITRLVILPLYPQFSISTSGSSLRLLESIFRKDEYLSQMPHTVIPSWYRRGGYVRAMSTLILNELNSFESPDEVHIFFSAHGVPVSYVEKAGDPYRTEMEECVHLIMKELKYQGVKSEHTLAYQSRVGPVEWLKPYTDEKIKELAKEGIESLLAVPISFVSEHIETLEEIDMEYRELALESGIKNWGRVPALGCEPTFIADLADAVIEALPHVGAMAGSPSEHKQMRLGTINLS